MIPQKFLDRMRQMPGFDFAAFETALETPAVRALRVNTLKATAEKLIPLLPFSLSPLPFGENAFYAPSDKVGALPAHHAGMFYMQDPSAISTVAAAAPGRDIHVIDLCAAPGGKSTQLAAAIGENGILVANEYVSARCRVLQGNIERMGAKNAIVTNLPTETLADFYGPHFDLVVADVPCSGEGMFRKYEVASEEWSTENVAMCATRQREILENAARLTRPGGRLLYSTCTFSLEENEQNIDAFLIKHPDFSLLPVTAQIARHTADGVNFDGCAHDLTLCRRFYPHLSPGEGQFVALLQRSEAAPQIGTMTRDGLTAPDKKTASEAIAFLQELLSEIPQGKRLAVLRDTLWLAPDFPIPSKGVFAPGVCVGTLQKGRIEPHHQLAAAYGNSYRRKIDLAAADPRVLDYLRGEEIPLNTTEHLHGNGYAALLYCGAPVGGGKIVSDRFKNHYPKGLRNRR
ncbi:MAG: SAM-dependent methyltransferase [Ruminococcaceae bacterium]|nr:SAM-dependent methyltransferase [Oscillospiraceae bacterium]